MKRKIDLTSWPRKEHFLFFKDFEEPFFGLCVTVDCTGAYGASQKDGHSFFLSYLHKALAAANATEAFRCRIDQGEPVVFDQINASPTVGRDDGTFGFSYMDYHPDFAVFEGAGKKEMERIKRGSGLELSDEKLDVIHFSSVPWIRFSGLSHARRFSIGDSIPKITFGKMTDDNGRKTMPMSIHAHHGLVDALHVGQFLEHFQDLLNG
ncbi:MAG: hypothetical protein KF852_15165 [Saprospiraceae bacterium]|nr:hypothetical protein [Saprospiraceae bacterium]